MPGEVDISLCLAEDLVRPGTSCAGEAVVGLAAETRVRSLVVVVECETFIRRSSRLSFTEDAEIEHQGRHTTFQGQQELIPASDSSEGALLPAGQSRLPFSVRLADSAPGSLSSADKGRNGKMKLRYQIAYFAKAEVELGSGTRKLSDRAAFRVEEPSSLAQFPAYFGFVYHKEAEEVVSSGFLRRHTGSVVCALEFARHHYSPAEPIHFTVTLRNKSKRTVKGVDITLTKYEQVVKRGEPVRDELDWPSTTGTVVVREKLKRRVPPGATEELRSSVTLPADLPFTTSPLQPRLISTRYELTLKLYKQKQVLHSTELLILPPARPADELQQASVLSLAGSVLSPTLTEPAGLTGLSATSASSLAPPSVPDLPHSAPAPDPKSVPDAEAHPDPKLSDHDAELPTAPEEELD